MGKPSGIPGHGHSPCKMGTILGVAVQELKWGQGLAASVRMINEICPRDMYVKRRFRGLHIGQVAEGPERRAEPPGLKGSGSGPDGWI